jgi:hypothetical protein
MKVYVPSYHKEDRKIGEIFNKKEVTFVVQQSQSHWYSINFPNAEIITINDIPPSPMGCTLARQKILETVRNRNDEWVLVIDDDFVEFQNTKHKPLTIEEVFKICIDNSTPNTVLMGVQSSNIKCFLDKREIFLNKEGPDAQYFLSKKAVGNYNTTIETWDLQDFAFTQIENKLDVIVYNNIYVKCNYHNEGTTLTDGKIAQNRIDMCNKLTNNTILCHPNLILKSSTMSNGCSKVLYKGPKKGFIF